MCKRNLVALPILLSVLAPYLSLFAQDKAWDQLIQAARKEGKVVVVGSADAEIRKALPAKFKDRFGIAVEYIGTSASDLIARLRAEKQSGLYTIDVLLMGVINGVPYYAEKLLAPVPPLIVEEIVEPAKWRNGKLQYIDPEQKYFLRFFDYLNPLFVINTNAIKRDEIRSIHELTNPKWKGKISLRDPFTTAHSVPVVLYMTLGESFIKKLYVDMQPKFTADRRQQADWLARGTQPISIGVLDSDVDRLKKDGFPVEMIVSLPDFPGYIVAGSGNISIYNGAPHPNAARLFANWLLSREGLAFYAKIRGEATLRQDIDPSTLTLPELIPKPGVKYLDAGGWEFGEKRLAITERIKEILKANR